MKRIAWIGLGVVALALGVAGCGWETGGDATTWSSAYNWVNFSGTYRNAAGGLLVTDYTTGYTYTPPITNTPKPYLTVTGEAQGDFAVGDTLFKGTLKHKNIVPGSVTITLYNDADTPIDSYSDEDNSNGVLTPGGTITYVTGAWKVDRGLANPAVQAGYVRATYSYYVANAGDNSGGSGSGSGPRPGSTGSIYAFNIVQQGQNVKITDNNGATYTGYIGEMRTASGVETTDEGTPQDGDTLIATIECTGRSAAGRNVKIVGSLQGTVAAQVFTGRTLTGTWIENPGKTGDINGQANSITMSAPTTTVDTNTAAMAVSP
jgi:hypothetical protein